ncbi:MAG: glycerol-3-phosphate dehydrogenase/oxidase [Rhodospirillales bacterium]|nr:glycerol-3-phosphate dehydrogenase/oxidase [Rhodospirillales bacterium]
MKRNLSETAEKPYDLLIIGGGISGACIAWDAALRGLKVALVEKGDFGGATSSATSKLVHGGLRYLRNFEISLVRNALRERRIWMTLAPHLVYPLPFLMPAYGHLAKGLFALKSGLTIYEALSFDRNWLLDGDKAIPPFETFSKEETLALEPGLEKKGLTGAVLFHDCQMYSPERLTLEVILSAVEMGAEVMNYAEVTRFVKEGELVSGAVVKDVLTGKEETIRAALTINAAGPWADLLLNSLTERSRSKLIRSKGIHLITRALSGEQAVAVPKTGGHFFILPWRGYSILGTTDTIYEGDPDDVHVTEKDIEDFLHVVNEGFPGAELTRDDVLYAYCGLRPLVDDQTDVQATSSYDASRKSEIYDHDEKSGIKGLLSVIGGKYTTSRYLAEETVDLALRKLGKEGVECQTHAMPLVGGEIGRFSSFCRRQQKRYADVDPKVVANLCRNYGSRADEVMDIAKLQKNGFVPLTEGGDLLSEVLFAVRFEMAQTLDDVLFRRTGIGTLGDPGEEVITKVSKLMAKELGWSQDRLNAEIVHAMRRFETVKVAN